MILPRVACNAIRSGRLVAFAIALSAIAGVFTNRSGRGTMHGASRRSVKGSMWEAEN